MEGVWGGEIVIRIYYMKKAYSIKEKNVVEYLFK